MKQKIGEKCVRERWQQITYPADKTIFSRSTRELKQILNKARSQDFLKYMKNLNTN